MATAVSAGVPAAPAELSWRTSVLVLPFESRGNAGQVAMADDYLMEAFAGLARFTLIEREKLDRVLLEQKLSREKLTASDRSLQIGRLLAADQMLHGTVEEVSGETVVTVRMVATVTSASREYSVSGPVAGMREFRQLISGIASKVVDDFPVREGKIIGRSGRAFRTDIAGRGVRTGLEVVVCRSGETVRHPESGKILGRRTIKIASGTLSAVAGGSATITLSQVEKGRTVTMGDLVITK